MPILTEVALFGCQNIVVFDQHSYSNTKVFVYDVCLLRIDDTIFKDPAARMSEYSFDRCLILIKDLYSLAYLNV